MKKIISTIWVFFLSFSAVIAWNWLIAENWDLLNLSKWNELIAQLDTKLSNTDILPWSGITLTNSWSQVIIDSAAWSSIPFIDMSNLLQMWTTLTDDLSILGQNFTPNTSLTIPGFDWSINSISVVSPTQIDLNVTSWSNEVDYDIVLSNNGTLNSLWSWNGVWYFKVWPVLWIWVAWTYNETFESNTLWSWSEVTWLTANVSFQVNSNGTPSGSTWPSWAAAGTYYIYTEASNPNFPNRTFAIETDNFRHAQSISFDYHMYWADMGTLEVQTSYNNIWTTVYTLAWQQQTAETQAWDNTWNIDLSNLGVEKIRIFYTSGDNYTWDASVDNISIISQ